MWTAASTWVRRRVGIAFAAAAVTALTVLSPALAGDHRAPGTPTEVKLQAVAPASVSVSWTISKDNRGVGGVAGYELFVGNQKVGTTAETRYTFSGLACGTTYMFGVDSFDSAGNRSDLATISASTAACPAPADTTPPSSPWGLAETGATETGITLAWNASVDNVGVAGYGLYLNGASVGTATNTSFTFGNLACGTSYTLGVDSVDAAGNRSVPATATATTATCPAPVPLLDTTPPSMPAGAAQSNATAATISLLWTASADNVGVAGYRLFRNAVAVGTTSGTSYTFLDLACGTSYMFAVEAYDAAGNRSPQTSVVASTTTCPASAPAVGTLTFPAVADARVEEAAPATNFGSSYLRADGGSDPDVESYLRFDLTGLTSAVSTATLRVYASSGTADGPAVYPAGTAWSEGAIAWSTHPARTGGAIANTGAIASGSWIEYNVSSVVRGAGTYSFVLATTSSDGVNLESREGTHTPQLVVTTGTPDTQAPSAPGGLARGDVTGASVGLSWSASTDNVGVAGYRLYRNGAVVGTTTGMGYTFTGLACGTSYTFGVAAYDGAGNQSASSQLVAATSACPPPPPPPPPGTAGCTRVAARSGVDSNPGTEASPFRTAQRLADSLSAGQVGCLRAGVYDETSSGYVLNLSQGGYVLRSYPGERARLVGIVQVRNSAAGVTLSGLDIEGTGGANTVKIYASDVVVEDSSITNLARGNSCMILGSNSGYGQAMRVSVRRNRFHDCGSAANTNHDHGIYAQNVVDGEIVGNVFWNSAAYAIQFYPNAQRTRFAHNVVDGDAPSIRGGVLFGGDGSYASSGNIVEDNVIAYAESYNVTSTWSGPVGTGNIARNNCVWAGALGNINTSKGGFTATANTIADPLFLDRVNRDYRLGVTSLCLAVVGFDAVAALGW